MGIRHGDIPTHINDLSERVIGAAIEVHRTLGGGLIERVYEEALCHELVLRGIHFERQRPVIVRYKGIEIPGQRLDLVIEGTIVVELKSTDGVSDAHLAQLVSYIRSGGYPLGLLINFDTPLLKSAVYRRINPDSLARPFFDTTPPSAPSAFGNSE